MNAPRPPGDPTEPVVDTRGPGADSCMNLTNDAFDALAPGSGFVLVADHDPVALRYMLDAERSGRATWQVIDDGPSVWRVRIAKTPG